MDIIKINKFKELGFNVTRLQREDGCRVHKYGVPEAELLTEVLRNLDNHDLIHFWNCYHRTISDPGSYVSAVVYNMNYIEFMEGNHGWSSEWKRVSLEDFIQLMRDNWDKDCDNGIYLNAFKITENKRTNTAGFLNFMMFIF